MANSDAVLVGTTGEIQSKQRKTLEVNGRKITVFYNGGNFYALDFHCYHAGGPLDMGNIEDINGTACIVCPWHRYKISLQTGEGVYQAIDPKNLSKPPCWKSKGVKQRTHKVIIENDHLYVILSECDQKLESDYYYSAEYKEIMKNMGTSIKVPKLTK